MIVSLTYVDWVPRDDFHPDETDALADFNRNKFLDLSKPLLIQVWRAPWTKEYYLSQVHNPRHLKESARLFQWDFLEVSSVEIFSPTSTADGFGLSLSRGPSGMWCRCSGDLSPHSSSCCQCWNSPIGKLEYPASEGNHLTVHRSITASKLLHSPFSAIPKPTSSAVGSTLLCFFCGNVIWTLLEYAFHRFLFHVDYYLPDTNWAMLLHFLLHGIHHYLPMDGLRLVMPPTLFLALETPMTQLAHAILPGPAANGVISGAFAFYILYDCMHYALHHTRLPRYLAEMKRYHLAHHYKSESKVSRSGFVSLS